MIISMHRFPWKCKLYCENLIKIFRKDLVIVYPGIEELDKLPAQFFIVSERATAKMYLSVSYCIIHLKYLIPSFGSQLSFKSYTQRDS